MIVARPRACTRILAATLAATLALQPLAVNAAAIIMRSPLGRVHSQYAR